MQRLTDLPKVKLLDGVGSDRVTYKQCLLLSYAFMHTEKSKDKHTWPQVAGTELQTLWVVTILIHQQPHKMSVIVLNLHRRDGLQSGETSYPPSRSGWKSYGPLTQAAQP